MTALHQFGAEMLKLSKRLESYPAAASTTSQKPKLPPSPLLLQSSTITTTTTTTYNSHISTQRLIRSTTNASIANRRTNNRDEVGNNTRVHYNTQAGVADDITAVAYPLAHQSSRQAAPPTTETISVEQHGFISRTCKQQLPLDDQKLSVSFPRISINDTLG